MKHDYDEQINTLLTILEDISESLHEIAIHLQQNNLVSLSEYEEN